VDALLPLAIHAPREAEMLEALGVNFAFFEGFDSFAKVNDVLDVAWVEIGHIHFLVDNGLIMVDNG
jgi:hypothetical protein